MIALVVAGVVNANCNCKVLDIPNCSCVQRTVGQKVTLNTETNVFEPVEKGITPKHYVQPKKRSKSKPDLAKRPDKKVK